MSLYFVLATNCHLKSSQSKIAFISDTLFHSLRTNDKQDNKPNIGISGVTFIQSINQSKSLKFTSSTLGSC